MPRLHISGLIVEIPDEVSEKTSLWMTSAIEVEMEGYAGPALIVHLRRTVLGWSVSVSNESEPVLSERGLLEAYIRARIERGLTNAGIRVVDGLRRSLN